MNQIKILGVIALLSILAACRKSGPSALSLSSGAKASTSGMGGYNLTSVNDRAIAVDFNGVGSTGKMDHILLYRPGAGLISIMQNNSNSFSPIWQSTTGIGGYDLLGGPRTASDNALDLAADKIIAFDYTSSGHNDCLLCYRPGTKTVWILQWRLKTESWVPVFQSSTGIGGFDLSEVQDKIIAFDYNGSGKMDHLLIYRSGSAATVWILKNVNGTFSPVFEGGGIGGYNMNQLQDQIIAYDWNSSGLMDHLVCYRPGNEAVWVLQNVNGSFSPVYQTSSGFPQFSVGLPQDRIFAYDFTGNGHQDALFCYRPGTGVFAVEQRNSGGFNSNFSSLGQGLAGYAFPYDPTYVDGYIGDRGFAFDNQSIGQNTGLVFYDAGTNLIDVLNNNNESITQVF
ncbi:hypothetical protein [Dinghuibacter silviterrae]|uniref:VCBS repeat protein n=1 Tax=Dinghuibacter silviterrae TaxID=1539049 RepID=A0A4R8DHK7_9BACT|nr:hypothetical protein [Dinghuibacter silviterrae]TDW96596.1 hypothetical protein EDB95_4429 [Dinghuibacter silviterrae]